MGITSANNKHLGTTNELLFMAECMKRGWKVNMPFGEDNRYDVIVDTPGGMRRVQVKSCHTPDSRGRYRVNMRRGKRVRSAYCAADIDVLAAYVAPLNHWFLVPVDEIKTKQLDLAYHHHDCLEAWRHIYEPPK
jgi:hypothetical protein